MFLQVINIYMYAFIKFIDNYGKNKTSNTFNNFSHLLNIFQTDSIFSPAPIYKKKNKNKNKNKILLNNILSSIIEEEEKSKIAGSVNNSDNIYIQNI